MTINEFTERSEYLYHLTSVENARNILSSGLFYSTKIILAKSDLPHSKKQEILTDRRPDHVYVKLDGVTVMIRDQRPISIKALNRTLTDGWTHGEFIKSLNSRVFFWPNLKRLNIHFKRYSFEAPKIIRVRSHDMIQLNLNSLKFCHLNSGATRCHPKWKGPPPRGADTFVSIDEFNYNAKDVAEVTFENECTVPTEVWISNNPDGPWRAIT